MKPQIMAAALAATLLGVIPSGAEDLAEGEKLYKKVCRACHGPTAKGMASFPKLTGHDVEYLVMRLEQYRSGEKVGPNSALMANRVKKLTDEDFANVANYIVTAFE